MGFPLVDVIEVIGLVLEAPRHRCSRGPVWKRPCCHPVQAYAPPIGLLNDRITPSLATDIGGLTRQIATHHERRSPCWFGVSGFVQIPKAAPITVIAIRQDDRLLSFVFIVARKSAFLLMVSPQQEAASKLRARMNSILTQPAAHSILINSTGGPRRHATP